MPLDSDEFKRELAVEFNKAFEPIFKLHMQCSSNKSTPGDKLGGKLKDIETSISDLKNTVQKVSRSGSLGIAFSTHSSSAGSLNWGVPAGSSAIGSGFGGTSTPVVTSSASIPPSLLAQMKSLEARVLQLENRLSHTEIEMSGIRFQSQNATEAWMKLNAPTADNFVFFADAHSLLTVGTGAEVSTSLDVLQFEAASAKAGNSSSIEALIVASFKLELPSFFGSDAKNAEAFKDSRELPAVKTFEIWDRQDGFRGARYAFNRAIRDATSTLSNSVVHSLPPLSPGLAVSQAMINASMNFLSNLSEWISRQYTDLTGRGGESNDTWGLISHCVRAIFRELHNCRVTGRGPFPSGKSGPIVWACLQSHLRMREFVDNGFSADAKLSHILNIHLQDNAVMKTTFNALADKISET